MIELHLMRGLPRSGKSTKSIELSKNLGAPVASKDAIRLALHGERYLAEREEEVQELSIILLKSLILAGHDKIIIDGCHVDLKRSMDSYRSFLNDYDLQFTVHTQCTTAEECNRRAVLTKQEDLIPVIDSMSKDWVNP